MLFHHDEKISGVSSPETLLKLQVLFSLSTYLGIFANF